MPVALQSYESDVARWESALAAPKEALRPYVRRYQGWLEFRPGKNRRREVATGDVVLIINLGAPFYVINPRNPSSASVPLGSFVSGVSDSYVFTESDRSMHCIQVDLTPIGAHLLFGVPMHEMANHELHLEDILGPQARGLDERLYEAGTWEARFAILDCFIEDRFTLASSPDPGASWALKRLKATGGRARIGGLATALGSSDRGLIEAFREEVGLTPKTIARIIRFNRVTHLMMEGGPRTWLDIAYDCGYYDQAHLIHDFKQFAGLTPGEFLVRRATDGPLPD
ncbi:MAG: helix-turn-helix domain-containing protein [Dehalococcoidia bacterium]|nr:helix-turn-helix domain-containing protein [Dehalococcoidia bacterium]